MSDDLAKRLTAAATRYREQQLAKIRATVYVGRRERQFFQDKRFLIAAITAPAAYLHARDLRLPGSRYAAIIDQALREILRQQDKVEVRCMGVYLLHWVQNHMKLQGDRYIEEAKNLAAGRPVGDLLRAAMKGVEPVSETIESNLMTAVLAAANSLAKAPKGPCK